MDGLQQLYPLVQDDSTGKKTTKDCQGQFVLKSVIIQKARMPSEHIFVLLNLIIYELVVTEVIISFGPTVSRLLQIAYL